MEELAQKTLFFKFIALELISLAILYLKIKKES